MRKCGIPLILLATFAVQALSAAVSARMASSARLLNPTSANIAASRAASIDDNPCKLDYWACMDMFCMSPNDNGGRCACSNDSIRLDREYDAAVKAVNSELSRTSAIGMQIEYDGEISAQGANAANGVQIDNMECDNPDDIACKIGAAKYNAAAKLCEAEVPAECKSSFAFTKLQYAQNIRNDCNAYAQAVKDVGSKGRAAAAEARKSLVETASAKFDEQNNLNESECRIELRSCMNSADICGEDWTRCLAGVGEKRYRCENILNRCASVKESVWSGFAAEIAPVLKSAALLAESDARQSCLGRISDCIVNACRDNIAGETMDACLARPEMARSFCKIELEECDGGGNLWAFVKQKLAAMRVDRCAEEVRTCFVGACGNDFGNCIGANAETMRGMCPPDKLVACKQDNPNFSLADVDGLTIGVFLAAENKIGEQCQKAIDEKMIEVCGGPNDCADAFKSYSAADFEGAVKLAGIPVSDGAEWTRCKSDNPAAECENYPKAGTILIDDYMAIMAEMNTSDMEMRRIRMDLESAKSKINSVIAMLDGDPKVSWCIDGRDMARIMGKDEKSMPRFPAMTQPYRRIIALSGLAAFDKR